MEMFTAASDHEGLQSDVVPFGDRLADEHNIVSIENHFVRSQPPRKLRPIRCNGGSSFTDAKPLRWVPDVRQTDGCGFIPPNPLPSKQSQNDEPAALSSSSADEISKSQEAIKEPVNKKRKRKSRKKLQLFIESMMKTVVEKQEEMYRQLIEILEKKDNESIMREEAWKKQEMERAKRVEQARKQETSRSLALISLIQKSLGKEIQIPNPFHASTLDKQGDTQNKENLNCDTGNELDKQIPDPLHSSNLDKQDENQSAGIQIVNQKSSGQETRIPNPADASKLDKQGENQNAENLNRDMGKILVKFNMEEYECDPSMTRWPKSEVQALVAVQAALNQRFNEKGLKGSVWEEVAAEMSGMGYNRTPTKCREKWENMNKYYKRTLEKRKESGTTSKLCTYFSELEMLYKTGFVSANSHVEDDSRKGLQ